MDCVNTIITGSNANVFFGNNASPLGSYTLGATLRFIALRHHQGEIETIKPIRIETSQFSEYNNGNHYAQRAKENGIELYILSAPRGAQLPAVTEDGWASLDTPPYPVAPFLTTASETRVYSNSELKTTIVFVRQATEKWIDLFCSSMFRILPWYFTDGLSDDETALFKAISKKDADTFNNIINGLCERYDFHAARFKKILLGWDDGYRKQQIATLRSQCEEYHSMIARYQQEIATAFNRLEQSNVNLVALEAQGDSTDDSVYKFFMSHKQITIFNTQKRRDGNEMDYCITDTIEYFDVDAFVRLYNNPNSAIGGAPKDIKDIFYSIFVDGKGVFRVEGVFHLTNLASLRACSGTTSGQFSGTHLPHPHLYHHACLGGNENYINNYLAQGNWDMAIEQSIAAVKNINFGDSIVIGEFVSDVRNAFNTSRKCILADNGKEMTLREFLAYIRENKEENEDTSNG